MQIKYIILSIAFCLFVNGNKNGEMGNGPHGMGPFSFLTNASQTVKTDFETIMKDNSLTENERTQDIDDLIKDENDASLDAAYAAFKTKLAQREKDVTTKFNAKVANASLTSDQTSLLNSIVAIKNNGSLTRKEMKQEIELVKKSANKKDVKVIFRLFGPSTNVQKKNQRHGQKKMEEDKESDSKSEEKDDSKSEEDKNEKPMQNITEVKNDRKNKTLNKPMTLEYVD